jgi:hypothetical protein
LRHKHSPRETNIVEEKLTFEHINESGVGILPYGRVLVEELADFVNSQFNLVFSPSAAFG